MKSSTTQWLRRASSASLDRPPPRLALLLVGLLLTVHVSYSEVDAKHEKKFKWVTGEKKDYDKWAKDCPNNAGEKQYYVAIRDDGEWSDLTGKTQRPAVYETVKSPSKSSKLIWKQWLKSDGGNDHWYALNEEEDTFLIHKKLAADMRASLATISSAPENDFVKEIVKKSSWIGLWIPNNSSGGGNKGGFTRISLRYRTRIN